MVETPIVFSRPFRSPRELEYLEAVLESGHVHGDGPFTASASAELSRRLDGNPVLLTTSGTDALELCSVLLGIGPGDEVIMPSFTFTSAATAVSLFGAVPVFVDSEPDTGNVDPSRIADAITARTKAISIVHYGGVAADIEAISEIAREHGLPVIEDNAHGFDAALGGRPLGTFGTLAIQSFHDTKNIHCGEGGAVVVNDPDLLARAEIVREKGTDRAQFLRGQVDKYTWKDTGSSYLMSELSAAVLAAQLDHAGEIQRRRHHVWSTYATELAEWAEDTGARLMAVPEGREHPAHLFAVHLSSHEVQQQLLAHLRAQGVIGTFHYVPLDTSPAGERYGRRAHDCAVAADFSSRLVRLPLWAAMSDEHIQRVVMAVRGFRGN